MWQNPATGRLLNGVGIIRQRLGAKVLGLPEDVDDAGIPGDHVGISVAAGNGLGAYGRFSPDYGCSGQAPPRHLRRRRV